MRQSFKIDYLSSIVFSILILLTVFTRVADVPGARLVSKYLFVGYISWMFLTIIFKKRFLKSEFKLFLPLILFNILYIINATSLTNSDDLLIILNHLIFFMVVYVLANVTWNKKQIKMLSSLFYISFPALLLMSFVLTDELNRNTIGAYTYLLAFFPLLYLLSHSKTLKRTQLFFISTFTLVLIFSLDNRSVLLSIAVSILTFVIWKLLVSYKSLFIIYCLAIIGFIYWFIVEWPKAYTWKYYYVINDLSYRLTNKELSTGRERIWERLVNFMQEKPWLGYGSSTMPEHLTGTALSAHNSYIQIGLQVGLIGLIFLILFFLFVWKTLWKNRFDKKVKLVASYFVGIIIYQIFEVSLTQNQFGLGLLQWIIIGFGLSFSLNNNNKEPN